MELSGSLVFAEDSISLSIYDLAGNTLENVLVVDIKRYDQEIYQLSMIIVLYNIDFSP